MDRARGDQPDTGIGIHGQQHAISSDNVFCARGNRRSYYDIVIRVGCNSRYRCRPHDYGHRSVNGHEPINRQTRCSDLSAELRATEHIAELGEHWQTGNKLNIVPIREAKQVMLGTGPQ